MDTNQRLPSVKENYLSMIIQEINFKEYTSYLVSLDSTAKAICSLRNFPLKVRVSQSNERFYLSYIPKKKNIMISTENLQNLNK